MPYKDPEKRRQYQREYRARKKQEKLAAAKEAAAHQPKYTCKINRRYRLKRRYGLTIEEYDTLLHKQRFKCKCCGVHQNEEDRSFAVDHDHETKQVRGLLCNKCNRGIGLLGDSLEGLYRAVKYLESCHESSSKQRSPAKQRRERPNPKMGGLSQKASRRSVPSVSRQARGQEILVAGV